MPWNISWNISEILKKISRCWTTDNIDQNTPNTNKQIGRYTVSTDFTIMYVKRVYNCHFSIRPDQHKMFTDNHWRDVLKSFHTIDIEVFCRMKDYADVFCIVHCNKVSKPVKGKYLLLCMDSIMYLLLTWYTLIMF